MPARTKRKKQTTKKPSSVNASPLARTVMAAKRSKKKETITAAMKRAQQRKAMATRLRKLRAAKSTSLLERTVKAAKRQRKKEIITAALKRGRSRS
ncbi:hypothetical protein [Petrachloros mirabilis]